MRNCSFLKRCLQLKSSAKSVSLCRGFRTLNHTPSFYPAILSPFFCCHGNGSFYSPSVRRLQVSSLEKKLLEKPLEDPDYFGVEKLVTLEDLFKARVHYGHKKGSRNEHMKPYLYGCRLDVDIIDLDQTLVHMHKALNFLAHMAFRKSIILFVMKSHQFGHTVERLAKECGEYAHTREWEIGTFTNINQEQYGSGDRLRLPDVCVFLSVQSTPYEQHFCVMESAKLGIATVGVCDSNVNPTIVTYPIPGNDDSTDAIELYCGLFKKAVLLGKEKRKEVDSEIEKARSHS